MPLLPRAQRVRAIITTGLRREFRRPAAIVVTGMGAALVTISSIVTVLFSRFFLPPGAKLDLSYFAVPASNGAILFFVSLMAAIIGSGLIADDLHSMAFTLYLSRPITHLDYLLAKAVILAPLVSMITVLPLVITALVAAFLFPLVFSWGVALQAIGLSVAVGLLLMLFNTSVALFLSSLTRRKGLAAAGMFGGNFGLFIPASSLASGIWNPTPLYRSPWYDYSPCASAAFGAPGIGIDWPGALAILLGVTVLAALVTYLRMRAVEVITG